MHPFGKDCPVCMADEIADYPYTTPADRKVIYQHWLAIFESGYNMGFCRLVHRLNATATLSVFTELCNLAPPHIHVLVMNDKTYDHTLWYPYTEDNRRLRLSLLQKSIAACG